VQLEVCFSASAQAFCDDQKEKGVAHLERLIREVLACDPRPAYYRRRPSKAYFGMRLYHFEIKWQVTAEKIIVRRIDVAEDAGKDNPLPC
jgi:hypothetical protein